jgi:hypothetical protein
MPDEHKTPPVAGHRHNARVVVLDASIHPDVNDKVPIGPERMMGGVDIGIPQFRGQERRLGRGPPVFVEAQIG